MLPSSLQTTYKSTCHKHSKGALLMFSSKILENTCLLQQAQVYKLPITIVDSQNNVATLSKSYKNMNELAASTIIVIVQLKIKIVALIHTIYTKQEQA